MIQVIKNGELLMLIEKPNYIRLNKKGFYSLCSEGEAQGIAIDGTPYNLAGREPLGDLEVVELVDEAVLTKAVQAWMDKCVQVKGYDSVNVACTYFDTGNETYDNEGAVCRVWRSAVWAKFYEVLNELNAGAREMVTVETMIAELPSLEW